MTRDYSRFIPGAAETKRAPSVLETLGWHSLFAQQTDAEALKATPPVRVFAVHRSGLQARGDGLDLTLPPRADATVGDWLLLDRDRPAASRLLTRKSLFQRRAPGTGRAVQLIAANIDTVLVVASCNHDFNVARLERYLALAFQAQVQPVIVLTKADLCDDPQVFVTQAAALSDRVPVVTLNALSAAAGQVLADWLKPGRTLAVLGSSGVGKSTLVNTLSGQAAATTSAIRQEDSKGRHTTTHRQLHMLPGGALILDTPGMRELQLAEAGDGLDDLFGDLSDLAARCRFSDCRHETEPGCAVQAALDEGQIDAGRLARWRKLAAEERFNSASLAERRAADRAFGKMVRGALKAKRKE